MDRFPGDLDETVGRCFHAAEQLQQGGLAGSAHSDEKNISPLSMVSGNIRQVQRHQVDIFETLIISIIGSRVLVVIFVIQVTYSGISMHGSVLGMRSEETVAK